MARSSTTYKPKWKNGPTTVIRIPRNLASDVLDYAKKLDGNGLLPDQQTLFETDVGAKNLKRSKPVNVASVPLRSPFRYPGGKTWLIPYLRQWLNSLPRPDIFVEPFAGGAIGGLTVAFEDRADHVIIAEIDEHVAAVWQTILSGQAEWLARRILQYDLTLLNVKRTLARSNRKKLTLKEKAFLTILRNRVQRGGIMAPGAGLVKNGENNKGILSRWYPQTLARRIRDIDQVRHQISFVPGDGMQLLEQWGNDAKAVFFVDPPYTKSAKRLYNNWEFDHETLFGILQRLKGPFLATYDNIPYIGDLADQFGFEKRTVKMKNTHHAQMTELLISRNLDWFDAIAE
jgi:DNA adenine methylase